MNRVNGYAETRAERRIAQLKARNEQRLKSFLNSKQRSIGLDTASIRAQIEEKERVAAADREAEAKYGACF